MRIPLYVTLRSMLITLIGLIILFGGCDQQQQQPQQGGTGQDEQKNLTLARKASAYTANVQQWFMPPSSQTDGIGLTDGTTMNSAHAVAWAYTGLTNGGHQETLASFQLRVSHSSIQNQSSWNEYLCTGSNPPYGVPFGNLKQCPVAGMVCYVMVAQALLDAGYSLDVDKVLSCDDLRSLYSTVDLSVDIVKVGDIVLYDWNNDGTYEHVGIVTGHTDYADPKNYNVISCENLYTDFQYGAAETTLGFMDNIPNTQNGVGANYSYIFVRPQ